MSKSSTPTQPALESEWGSYLNEAWLVFQARNHCREAKYNDDYVRWRKALQQFLGEMSWAFTPEQLKDINQRIDYGMKLSQQKHHLSRAERVYDEVYQLLVTKWNKSGGGIKIKHDNILNF